MGTFFRRSATLVTSLALMGGFAVAGAAAASAGIEGDSSCETGEVCFYWGQDYTGCVSTFYDDNSDHGYYYFKGDCKGNNEGLEDNAASAINKARYSNVYIFEDDNYGGAQVMIQNGGRLAHLGALRNNNSSHIFGIF